MMAYDDRKLESFLLDELPSSEREEIEQRIFADDDLFARVEEIETDLVDAYVAGQLTPALRDRFERSLAASPARREKALFGRILAERIATGGSATKANVMPFTRRHPAAFRGALAAALFAVLVGVPMFIQRNGEDPGARPDRVAVAAETVEPAMSDNVVPTPHVPTATDSAATAEKPLMAVNRPPTPAIASQATPALRSLTFVLSTVSLRSGSGLDTLELGSDVGSVVIQLILESDEFPSYNVDIRSSSGTSEWSATRIPVTTIDGGPALSLEIPSTALSSGRHELVLAGVDENGTEEVAYVDFRVVTRP